MDYNMFKEELKKNMHIQGELDEKANLLSLGINSLQIMKMISELKKNGIKVNFMELFEKATLEDWWQIISKKSKNTVVLKNNLVCNIEDIDEYNPFEMTDVQYAYLVGRNNEQVLGGVSTHAYIEFEGENIDVLRLKKAYRELIKYHPMLRVKFFKNGTQQIMKETSFDTIDLFDFTMLSEEEASKRILDIREVRSHRKLDIENGQVIGLGVVLLKDNKNIIFFDIDLLVADVQSLKIVFRDLVNLYKGESLKKESANWSFAGYLQKDKARNLEEKEEAKKYWLNRLENFNMAPILPLKKQPEQIEKVIFKRREYFVEMEKWNCIQELAKTNLTTPAMVLLAAYVEVIGRYSANDEFLINIPLFNRNTEIPNIEDVVADFTTILLVEVELKERISFKELLKKIDNQVHKDISYSSYSGVELQREIAKLHRGNSIIAPVVYACNLGMPLFDKNIKEEFGKCSYMISQTPQIWIDFQLFEDEDGLKINWDTVDELFPDGLIDRMFKDLKEIIELLGSGCADLDKEYNFNIEEKTRVLTENKKCIHEGMYKIAETNPELIAIIDSKYDKKYTYKDLAKNSNSIANSIKNRKIRNTPIAITLERGYNQIVAAYGILASGNYYVPISVTQPKDRRSRIHNRLKVKYVITDRANYERINWPKDVEIILIEEALKESTEYFMEKINSESSAYVILTSGSTGEPKGVEIAHSSAWNTIEDINEKYNISQSDVAFSISDFDFDLSVYDIFGILSAGAALVIIPQEEKKNTKYWLQKINKYNVTIWNSVPILLDMLLIQGQDNNVNSLPLRLVMLSGDWIRLDLPERLQKVAKKCVFVALGGATEASIWSNYYEVKLPIPKKWSSIPYGAPLKNQFYRIVDSKGRDVPNWVVGELYIGGAGVAKGYVNDEILTKAKFFEEKGIRWYKTGDLGRFWSDGTIEFLGRKDSQVKIRGHRIEIGEIETALKEYSKVKDAYVVAVGEEKGDKHLVGYVTLKEEEDCHNLHDDIKLENIFKENYVIDNSKEIDNYIVHYNNITDYILYSLLENNNLLNGNYINSKEAYKALGCKKDNYEDLFNKWLDRLSERNFLNKVSDGIYEKKDTIFHKSIQNDINNDKRLSSIKDNLKFLLNGEENPLDYFYIKNSLLSPLELQKDIPGYMEMETIFIEKIRQCAEKMDRRIRILDIDNRNYKLTEKMLAALSDLDVEYTYSDSSSFFLDNAKEKLFGKDVNYKSYDINDEIFQVSNIEQEYNIIISYYSLHRGKNLDIALKNIKSLLASTGIIMMTEMSLNVGLMDIIVGLLEKKYGEYEDLRKQSKSPLLSENKWQSILSNNGFAKIEKLSNSTCYILTAKNKYSKTHINNDELKEYLKDKLVEYMIPKVIIPLNKMPVTKNGKVNRKKLINISKSLIANKSKIKPETELQKRILRIWEEIFNMKDIGLDDNYFELGGDSLIAVKLISKLKKEFNREVTIGKVFENPTIKELSYEFESMEYKECKKNELKQISIDIEKQNEPFPLTDVQYAYWIGRNGLYDLGNVATHCYFEMDAEDIDYKKLCDSWNKLINAHGMMRAVILQNGEQQILDKVDYYNIKKYDFNGKSSEETNNELMNIRKSMEHQVINTAKWPLFDLKVSYYNDNMIRIHISFDNIIFDGFSMFTILEQWGKLYRNEEYKIDEPDISFRDYVIGINDLKTSNAYEKDKKYWLDRIEELANIPELPIKTKIDEELKNKFKRRSYTLGKGSWQRLKKNSKMHGITPSVLLLTAFSEVLRLYSKRSTFTINVTRFNAIDLHPQVNKLIGDFTTLTLLEVNNKVGSTFTERSGILQKQLIEDLNHSYFSGVEVEREIRKQKLSQSEAIMPVVFTSGLGVKELNEDMWLGKINYNVSQTPQVWLDNQVSERNGRLEISWDSVDELFYDGVLQEMFNLFVQLLEKLSLNEGAWRIKGNKLLEVPNLEKRIEANNSIEERVFETLDGLFIKAVKKYSKNTALVYKDTRLTYNELYCKIIDLKERLIKKGITKGDIIGVYCGKSVEQIVCVFAILFAGGVYLPIDINNPRERVNKIVKKGNVKLILTKDDLEDKLKSMNINNYYVVNNFLQEDISGDYCLIDKSENSVEDLAYIIYTSGSTGEPKGVMISHGAAVNTIKDINGIINISCNDSVLAISNLHFDLSVYDIFGMLSSGSKIVIPTEEKKNMPSYWVNLIQKEKITIWNTVPAYMKILVDYLDKKRIKDTTLKHILLSGDWITFSLVKKIRETIIKSDITALGGATEASIWSNSFKPIDIEEEYNVVPYGKPLSNQRYYILKEDMTQCPNYVTGYLYIAGDGLALGYYKDIEKTKEKFIYNEDLKEKLYCTGDLGRYLKDGNIEFLGREDFQVKINGYRIELGEIESVIRKHNEIDDAVAVVVNSENKGEIVVFVLTKGDNLKELNSYIKQYLPNYMIPSKIIKIDSIPLSSNGKVDKKILEEKAREELQKEIYVKELIPPSTEIEEKLIKCWREVLDIEAIGVEDDFFEIGGNSLQAIQIVNYINEELFEDFEIGQLFSNSTVRKLGEIIEEIIVEKE